MPMIEKKQQQQEAAARATAEEASRNKNPTNEITYFDLRLENTTRKKRQKRVSELFPDGR